jgi:hypothetical protein
MMSKLDRTHQGLQSVHVAKSGCKVQWRQHSVLNLGVVLGVFAVAVRINAGNCQQHVDHVDLVGHGRPCQRSLAEIVVLVNLVRAQSALTCAMCARVPYQKQGRFENLGNDALMAGDCSPVQRRGVEEPVRIRIHAGPAASSQHQRHHRRDTSHHTLALTLTHTPSLTLSLSHSLTHSLSHALTHSLDELGHLGRATVERREPQRRREEPVDVRRENDADNRPENLREASHLQCAFGRRQTADKHCETTTIDRSAVFSRYSKIDDVID